MQKPGHRKNPAAVALGRLGGLAGRGKAKARKVTSEMARRAVLARWAKYKLLCVVWLACCHSAFGQGSIFSYTFTGDTSPLGVSVAFTASWEAVATRVLRATNIISGYMQMGDRRVPIGPPMYFPVTAPELGGKPIATDYVQWLNVVGIFPGNDLVEIVTGVERSHATIYRDRYPLDMQSWPSDGMWHVTLVPEPSSLFLLLLAIAGWQARRLVQRARR